ncbi:MAG: CPBP family intramembrane metalloprotease [Chitinispirillaceae bacterium]|nr:CPBP family intramembrane metalloprotease [Chitinispirillaceae bacterium]
MKTKNKTTLFLILTFVISYSLAGIYKLSGGNYSDRIGFTIIGAAYMFIPMISAIIVKKFVYNEKIGELLISFKINRWFFIAWGLMPVLAFSTFGISLLLPDVIYSPDMSGMFDRFESMMTPEQFEQMKNSVKTLPFDPIWITLLQGLFAGVTINAIAGFGEELGWRGFLLIEFKEMSFFKASIIIGFIWGIWHAPLILMGHNYPQHPQTGVIMMILWCILLTPLFIYITLKSKSVIAAAILHGTLNATAGLAIMKIEGGNDLTTGVTGLAGFLTLFIFLTGIFIFDYFITKDKIFINKISNYL